MATPATFGSFNFNDNVNYFIIEKPFSMNPVSETFYKIARFEGTKRTSAITNERSITVKLRVIGTSRADLETRLNTLYTALSVQQQALSLYAIDGRYWIADCVAAEALEQGGSPIATTLQLTFIAQQPYAISPTMSTVSTGTVTLTNSGGNNWVFPTRNITGGGNVFARGTVVITKLNTGTWTSLALTNTTDSTTITVTTNLPSAINDFMQFNCDPTMLNGYTALKNQTGNPTAFTGAFPSMEPGTNQWNITIVSTTSVQASATYSWFPRWL